MKAAYKKGSSVEVREKTTRILNAGEIRLDIEACGICGTDIHGEESDYEPFGHEIAGVITELGPGVDYLKVGQKVVLDSATPCGRCGPCRNTQQELCEDIQSFFYLDEFGFSEQMIAPAVSAIPYSGISPEVASLQEPLGVAIDLVRLADIGTENRVLIIGQGPIGLMATKLVKDRNPDAVYVSDFRSRTARYDLATSFGIDGFVDAEKESLSKYDFDGDIDRVLVTAPPPTLSAAFQVACKGAIVSFIGIGHGDAAFCRFDANDFHFKKLQLRASFASPALYGPMAMKYLSRGIIPGEKFISHQYSLDSIQDALVTARDDMEALKVVIVPEGRNL